MDQEFEPKTYGEACQYVDAIEKGKVARNRALNFLQTVAANLDNEKLTDAQFSQFMRNNMMGIHGWGYKTKESRNGN